jgi:hypothetical protein
VTRCESCNTAGPTRYSPPHGAYFCRECFERENAEGDLREPPSLGGLLGGCDCTPEEHAAQRARFATIPCDGAVHGWWCSAFKHETEGD